MAVILLSLIIICTPISIGIGAISFALLAIFPTRLRFASTASDHIFKIMLEDVERINSRRWNLSARISSALRSCRQQRRNDRTVRELLRQQRRAAAIAATAETTPERRRLPRGWWPDQGKREGLKLKAMNCLKDETFVSSHF